MKIGIDCRIFSSRFTGIGRYTSELVKNFIRINEEKSHNHELVLFFNQPVFDQYKTTTPNVKKILVNAKHYSYAEQTKFLKILNKEKPDITHFPHFNVPFFYKRPYTVTIHDLILSLFPGQKMNKFYHRIGYNLVIKNATKKAKKIIAVSNNTKEDIIKFLKVPEEKIEVIYNGISTKFQKIEDPNILNNTLKKFNINKPFLLYTGVWRSHKNLPRLIEAFSILKKEYSLNINLVITGNPDPYYPEVHNTVKKLELENDVIFPGLIDEDELIHLYNAAKIFVFPSLYEGFGLPPLEAMRCKTPVVASNSSSIPEVCGKENSIFFDPYNIRDIAEKIHMLYKNPELQNELIEKGYRHSEKFSWENMAEKTYQTITQAI